MLSVPSVTMNGGRLILVTSRPLIQPAMRPKTTPMTSARNPGTPLFAASDAMIIVDRIAIAPTDRSIPAVRMTRVCPRARAATTAVCWTSRDNDLACRNRWLTNENTMIVRTSRISGLTHG